MAEILVFLFFIYRHLQVVFFFVSVEPKENIHVATALGVVLPFSYSFLTSSFRLR